MRSFKVELLRFGTNEGVLQDRYLVAADGAPLREINVDGHINVLRALNTLRYRSGQDPLSKQRALDQLAELVGRFLQDIPETPGPLQIDIVTDKVELWLLPFELVKDKDGRYLLGANSGRVLITRRVRRSLAESVRPWPEKPRVLFAWHGDVDARPHRLAFYDALEPWLGPIDEESGDDPLVARELIADTRPVLTELRNASLSEIESACQAAAAGKRPFTHVHFLAHGKEITSDLTAENAFAVSLRGGPAAAEALCAALRAGEPDGPTVVTLAICDSSNASNSINDRGRIAYELHEKGVSVVVGSQFPLTELGAALFMRAFYKALLAEARDVRAALLSARDALCNSGLDGHDWASVTAHVRLPEGYSDQLHDATPRILLAQLNTASRFAQRLAEDEVTVSTETLARVEALLDGRVRALQSQVDARERKAPESTLLENLGLLASAHKRLAELVFCSKREGYALDSRSILERAGRCYHEAHERALSHHWSGTQHLAICAAVRGSVPHERFIHWHAALHAARRDAAFDPTTDESTRERVIWALGSIAELCLLAPLVGTAASHEGAAPALERLVLLANREPRIGWAIDSTWRQLRRYVHWWTSGNGFFPERTSDLSSTAGQLVVVLQPHLSKARAQ